MDKKQKKEHLITVKYKKTQIMKTKILLSIIAISTFISMNAQFEIDGQFRTRAQILHGYKKPVIEKTNAAIHVGQRSRLNLKYQNNKIKTLFSIQDVRVWGDEDIVNHTGVKGKSYNTIDVYEAWVEFKTGEMSRIRIGRQEMKYDDQRHISWRNWWDRGQTYDAVLYSYLNKKSGWQVDLSGSFNSKSADLSGNDYSDGTEYFGNVNPIITQNFIYIKKSMSPKWYLSLTGIAAGYQKEGTKDIIYVTYTEGLHLNYNMTKKATNGIFAKNNLFLQNGKNIAGKNISANMITAQIGYRAMNKQLELSACLERLSGNNAENTDPEYLKTDHTYNLLYGGRHPYYEGYMDWFVIPKTYFNAGIQNISLNLLYKFNAKNVFKLSYNNVTNVNNIKKNTLKVSSGSSLAQFIDLTFIKKFDKNIKLHTGFSYAIPSNDFNNLKGITNPGKNYFFYTMLTVKPKFFSSNK